MHCLATLLLALLATTTVVVSTDCNVTKCIKNTNYTGIEQSLFSRTQNLVNLSQAFFPANRQPSISVVVTYQFEDDSEPVVYRWLDSPVNLLIHSDLLFYLSLTIYKVDVRYVTVTLDPIEGFEDEEVNKTAPNSICQPSKLPGHHLLNNLTVNLLSYALHRSYTSRIDLSTESGYSVYVFDSELSDFCVFDEVSQFLHLRIVLWCSFFVLELAVAFASPLLMVGGYSGFKEKMEVENSRLRYFVWAFIVVTTLLVVLMYTCNILSIVNEMSSNYSNKFSDITKSNIALIVLLAIFPLLDVLGAAGVMWFLSWVQHVKDRSRCIDCYYINCLCRKRYHQLENVDEYSTETVHWQIENVGPTSFFKFLLKNVLHLYSMVVVTLFTQLVLFNSIFVSLAVVAAPVEAGSVLILYLASLFTFISFIALVLKMAHTIQIYQKSFCGAGFAVFVLVFAGVGLFAGFMYLYTILTQEYRNSRGVIAFIGPILPSLLASAVGGILIRIFPCVKAKNSEDIDAIPNPTTSTAINSNDGTASGTVSNRDEKVELSDTTRTEQTGSSEFVDAVTQTPEEQSSEYGAASTKKSSDSTTIVEVHQQPNT